MRQVAHGVAFFQGVDSNRVLELMLHQCSAKRAAYQAIQNNVKGNDVKIAVKTHYMLSLNQRYISDAVSMAQQITEKSVLFGGKRAWKQMQSGILSKEDWQLKRNNQLYSRGDKAKGGNPNIRVVGDKILINDPAKHGLWIEGKLFLPDKWFPNWKCYAVQILFRNGQFDVNISWDIDATPEIFCETGMIGVDINPDGCAITNVDANGNIFEHFYLLKQRIQFARKNKRANDIRLLAKEIVDYALFKCKPICLEKLSFNAKSKQKGSRKFKRMKSNFVYRQIIDAIKTRAFGQGAPIVEVNPAFTTDLGVLKYQKMYSLSSHNAAALVIARRGMGFLERQDFTVMSEGSKNQTLTLEGRGARIALSKKASTWLLCSGMFLRKRQSKRVTLTGSNLAAGQILALHSAIRFSGGHEKPPGESDSITGRIGET